MPLATTALAFEVAGQPTLGFDIGIVRPQERRDWILPDVVGVQMPSEYMPGKLRQLMLGLGCTTGTSADPPM